MSESQTSEAQRSETRGKFVWYELMTTDGKAAESFYQAVIGWQAKDSGLADRSYTTFSAGPSMIGRLLSIPQRARGARPGWIGYIGVDDVDAYAARVKAAGGAVHHAPENIPGVGRFSIVADPHGAVFALFQPESAPRTPSGSENISGGTPGHVGWHELHAGEVTAAFSFYSGLFGWTKADAMDMGAMGIYQIFATGGPPIGGMMTKTPQMPAPLWLYYFNVESIEAAAERVRKGGGKVAHEPTQVPGGSWIVQCFDPQGAMFALVGPKLS